jgi:dTDP-L-rhamnose 4-epimerase
MGLIGSNLAGQLASNGYSVTVVGRGSKLSVPDVVPKDVAENINIVSGDPSDIDTLEELVKKSDAIFHKASSVGMSGAVESARDYVGENLFSTATLVDVLRKSGSGVKKVILGSSIAVYGEGCYMCGRCGIVRPILRFGPHHPASPPRTWNPPCPKCGGTVEPTRTPETADRNGESIYAVTRKTQEDLLTGTCRILGLPLTILRYSTVLGPGQSWHNPFTKVMEMIATGEAPVIHEDGQQTRDFIFIDDLVSANLLVLKYQDQLIDQVNVSANHLPLVEFINELSRHIAEALGKEPVAPVIDGKLIAGDVRHCWVDCSKLKEEMRFAPKTKLSDGIRSLVDWFVEFKGLKGKTQAVS